MGPAAGHNRQALPGASLGLEAGEEGSRQAQVGTSTRPHCAPQGRAIVASGKQTAVAAAASRGHDSILGSQGARRRFDTARVFVLYRAERSPVGTQRTVANVPGECSHDADRQVQAGMRASDTETSIVHSRAVRVPALAPGTTAAAAFVDVHPPPPHSRSHAGHGTIATARMAAAGSDSREEPSSSPVAVGQHHTASAPRAVPPLAYAYNTHSRP